MTEDIDARRDYLRLTFSQRHGEEPLPDPIRHEYLSDDFRIALAHQFQQAIDVLSDDLVDMRLRRKVGSQYKSTVTKFGFHVAAMILRYKMEVLHKFPSEISDPDPRVDSIFIGEILQYGEYDDVLTLCEWFLRSDADKSIKARIESVFANYQSAYAIGDFDGVQCVYPKNEASGESVSQSLTRLNSYQIAGVMTHLRDAAIGINSQDYAKSVHSSISAVESVARQIAPGTKSLSDALNTLEQRGLITHGALKSAFGSLYGYTSDEEGIRHPLLTQDAPNVGFDEALFMFGACASFADYLVSKNQQLNSGATRAARTT